MPNKEETDSPSAFADLRFKIECNEIILVKNADQSRQLKGPGEIWQNSKGVLEFRLFLDEPSFKWLHDNFIPPGQALQQINGHLFSLTAQAYNSIRWFSQNFLLGLKKGNSGAIISGELYDLVKLEQSRPFEREVDCLTLRLRSKLAVPFNETTETVTRIAGEEHSRQGTANAAKFGKDDFQFKLYHEDEHTVMDLTVPKGKLTDAAPLRVAESLQFVLGIEISLLSIEVFKDVTTTRLMSAKGESGVLKPPLQSFYVGNAKEFWGLFLSYFFHVYKTEGEEWHPISGYLGQAIEATVASTNAQLLALSVAVEGLVGECFSDIALGDPRFLEDLGKIEEAIKSISLEDKTVRRLEGTLNQMKKARNTDFLREFIRKSNLPEELYKSWSDIRNASAHGKIMDPTKLQKIRLKQDQVLFLLYSLVLEAIGYEGPRTVYGLVNPRFNKWPIYE